MVHGGVPRALPRLSLVAASAALLAVSSLVGCGPRRVDVVMSEGIAAQRDGDRAAAAARYQTALKLDTRARGAANNLALIAIVEDRDEDAVARVKDELDRHPALDEARLNRAWLLVRGGRHDEIDADLVELAELAAGKPPSDPRILRRRAAGRALLAINRLGSGAPWLEVRSVWERPLAELLPAAALTDDDRALDALTLEVLGLAALRAGEHEAAVELLVAADAPHSVRARASALAALGRLDEALATLLALAEPEPVDHVLRAWVGLSTDRVGDAEQALAAVPEPPETLTVAWHQLHAALASRRTDWAVALQHLDAAIAAAAPGAPGLWLDRAVALAHLGRLDDARVSVIGVLRDHPAQERAVRLKRLLAE